MAKVRVYYPDYVTSTPDGEVICFYENRYIEVEGPNVPYCREKGLWEAEQLEWHEDYCLVVVEEK